MEVLPIAGLLLGVFIIIYEHLTGDRIFFKVVASVAIIGAFIVDGPIWGHILLALVALGALLADVSGVEG